LERRFVPARNAAAEGPKLLGKALDVPGANWEAHPLSTVLYMSTRCRFCLQSMPYYRKLATAKDSTGAHVPLAIISMDPQGDIEALLSAEHIKADGIYRLPKSDPKLRVTPMLLIADSKGIVRRAYVGELGPVQEAEFLGILRSGSL